DMEGTYLQFRAEAGWWGALPPQRLAPDARNLVRDWFRRQMPQQRFVDADLQKADQITLWQYAAHRKGAARTRQVVARWAKRPFGRKPGRTRGLGCRSEEHTSELQSLAYLVCRLLLEKKKNIKNHV